MYTCILNTYKKITYSVIFNMLLMKHFTKFFNNETNFDNTYRVEIFSMLNVQYKLIYSSKLNKNRFVGEADSIFMPK